MRIESLSGHYFTQMSIDSELKSLMTLRDRNADGNQRFGLACNFCYWGYTEEETLEFIITFAIWDNIDREKTFAGIRKAYEYKRSKGQQGAGTLTDILNPAPSSNFRKLTDEEIINKFLTEAKPWNVSPPGQMNQAVWYYHSLGAHIIPMKASIKLPAVKWKEYQDVQPKSSYIASWDFSHGLILLGTDRHCFLDIDIRTEKHPNGLIDFDEALLDGWYYERTKNGGYHVLGQGCLKNLRGKGAEIKGKGGYIVTYPTEGYKKC